MLYLIFVAPIFNVTAPLSRIYIFSNGPLYEVLYFYADLLLNMTLSSNFNLYSTIFIFMWILYLLICA